MNMRLPAERTGRPLKIENTGREGLFTECVGK